MYDSTCKPRSYALLKLVNRKRTHGRSSARARLAILPLVLGCGQLGCARTTDVVAVEIGDELDGGRGSSGSSSSGDSPGGHAGSAGGGAFAGASAGGASGADGAGRAGATGSGGAAGADATGTGEPRTLEFQFEPTNFNPSNYTSSVSVESSVVLDCGTSTFDSSLLEFGNWCGQFQPAPVIAPQLDGPELVILPVASLTLTTGATLRLTGSRAVVFVVFGDALIAGTLNASASGMTAGAGGNWGCGASQGADGSGGTGRFDGASGGGGGGFATAGGKSGKADTDATVSAAANGGVPRGMSSLSPLLGGCAGGRAGECEVPGGAGGGAIQISAAGSLKISGAVRASGGAGATPCGAEDEGGGTGGGSGGAILLEGAGVSTIGATLEVSGGSGGSNGAFAGIFHCNELPGGTGATTDSSPGADGSDCQGGSPGGGGGYGRISILNRYPEL